MEGVFVLHIFLRSKLQIACRSQIFPFSCSQGNSRTMGIKRPSDFILTLEDDDIASQSESDADSDNVRNTSKKTKKRKVDDDLNSEFEFDGYRALDGVKGIDDDGWGFIGIPGMKE